MSRIKWIVFAVASIGFLVLLITFSNSSATDIGKINTNAIQVANSKNGKIPDHVFGKSGSKVTLIEYGDFVCPGCGSIEPIIKIITEQYRDQLQFVFRNYPLTNTHPNAKAAAAAAEAASLQGRYWEMHEKLYTTQSDWENLTGTDRTDFFVNYAKSLNLNATKFKTDMASSAVDKKISYDQAIGRKINIDSTPTFYLDGKKLDTNTWSTATKLKDAINTELTRAGIALPKTAE